MGSGTAPARGSGAEAADAVAAGHRSQADASKSAAPPPAQPHGHTKRFVEPYQFDADQRGLIDKALTDAGIDDASGRAIFIGAISYDVALLAAEMAQAFEQEPPPIPPPPVAAPSTEPTPQEPSAIAEPLESLIAAAERTRQHIESLDADAVAGLASALTGADPFSRAYGPEYLAAVARELGRIAGAATTLAPPAAAIAEPTPDAAADTKSGGAYTATRAARPLAESSAPAPPTLRFVRDAARVYREAFDLPLGLRSADPFPRALKAIASATGLPIPTRIATIKETLAPARHATADR